MTNALTPTTDLTLFLSRKQLLFETLFYPGNKNLQNCPLNQKQLLFDFILHPGNKNFQTYPQNQKQLLGCMGFILSRQA
jgi:hypothetical protein